MRMMEVTLGRFIAVGGFLIAVFYLLWRFLKGNIQSNGRRTVYADYRVKD
jgi:hypothetical protein